LDIDDLKATGFYNLRNQLRLISPFQTVSEGDINNTSNQNEKSRSNSVVKLEYENFHKVIDNYIDRDNKSERERERDNNYKENQSTDMNTHPMNTTNLNSEFHNNFTSEHSEIKSNDMLSRKNQKMATRLCNLKNAILLLACCNNVNPT